MTRAEVIFWTLMIIYLVWAAGIMIPITIRMISEYRYWRRK